mmetsp:Transcript_18936/g.28565  ORF Transcript_18936/g.28565 Transcript_18936/m.28565 type:complete len:1541 (-) Transcript_18936:2566-7188(-)
MDRELERRRGKRGRPKDTNRTEQQMQPVVTMGTGSNVALHPSSIKPLNQQSLAMMSYPAMRPLHPVGSIETNCAGKKVSAVYTNNDWQRAAKAATNETNLTPRIPVSIQQGNNSKIQPLENIQEANDTHPKKNTSKKKKPGRPRGRRFSNTKKSSEETAKKVKIKILDDEPNRIINPLVDIPRLENAETPNAADMHVWSDIIFSRPNTYPLSYYARLLGFNIPNAPSDKYISMIPSSIPLPKKIPNIAPLGTAIKFWKKGDDLLDYKEPVYDALSKETGEVVSTLKKAVFNSNIQRHLKIECLSLAKRLLGIDLPSFKMDDNSVDFGITSGNYSVRYQFVWYRVKCREDPKPKPDLYGMPAASTQLKKPSVSELVMKITSLGEIIHNQDSSKSTKQESSGDTTNERMIFEKVSKKESKIVENSASKLLLNKATTEGKDEGDFDERGQTRGSEIVEDRTFTVLMALAFEHARACNVYYAFVQAAKIRTKMLINRFRMIALPNKENTTPTTLLCDLNKTNSKHAFLLCQERPRVDTSLGVPNTSDNQDDEINHRMLVKLPSHELVKRMLDGNEKAPKRSSSLQNTRIESATKKDLSPLTIRLNSDSCTDTPEEASQTTDVLSHASWHILRVFPVQKQPSSIEQREDEIYNALALKRANLISIENKMEPKLRFLLKQVIDDRITYENNEPDRRMQREIVENYQKVLERRRELDLAFQKQRDQDMDAVCDICNDGEVTPENQILFCEFCNVAVHQFCYGIEKVPDGDYYCIACRNFGRERSGLVEAKRLEHGAPTTRTAPSPLPIICELCPRKEGAFIRTDMPVSESNSSKKWVHVVCAKWYGLRFLDMKKRDCVENVDLLKSHFREYGVHCELCKGNRGAFHKCRETSCKKWFHVTCARAYGLCEVIHGENCQGPVECNPWTLLCPDHSSIERPPQCSVTLDQLVIRAQAFPPEPRSLNRGFSKLSGSERRLYLADMKNERTLVDEILMKRLQGMNCEVCFALEPEGKNLTRCSECSVVFCDSCSLSFDKQGKDNKFVCQTCHFKREQNPKASTENPSCALCVQKGGWLRKARGFPPDFRMIKWKNNSKEYEKTLFGKSLWVHTLCYLWNYPELEMDETTEEVNLSNVIMSHGHGFVKEQNVCELCGHKKGMKKRCQQARCRQWGQANKPSYVHLTCGRQAGFEVNTREAKDGAFEFFVHCFKHSRCEDAFRARIEDLIEIEKFRVGKRLDMKDVKAMSISHASRLLNAAIIVLQNLGWAWRWAEWWVANGSNWEPLIEEGQDEKKMTKQQLKIIDSTPESRCKDARACRLVAFSAALRNRAYDSEVEGPTKMLDRALRALLATKSLVGPLDKAEIQHCAQWLGIAYRSKSRLLGFGEDKISINRSFRFCVNTDDNSAKFELGNRRLPGKQVLPEGQFFETEFHDVDDFLKPETLDDGSIYCRPRRNKGNATKGKAAGKKLFHLKVEDETKARSTGNRAVERKERQKSADKPLQSLIVGKNGTAEGSTVPQSVQRKETQEANYKKRQGPGRPPKSPKKTESGK